MIPRTAYGAARRLSELGLRAGQRLAIDTPDALGWLLGADLLGAASLIVEPSWSSRERAAVFADARPDLVVTGAPPQDGPSIERFGDERNWFYLPTTSGSSGSPKVLVRTRASWLRSFEALGPLPGPVLIPGPLSSSLFCFGALHALWCGSEPWLRGRLRLADVRGAGTVHVVPAMLRTLLEQLAREPGCGAPHTVVCGGAHLDEGTRARFAELLPETELLEYYGSAEHSLIGLGTEGLRPVPQAELDIRDGVLWVRSPLAYSGSLRAGEFHEAPEWSSVGDRVELRDGLLTVHGRDSAMIETGGSLVAAEEVEQVLRAVPGVDDVVVAPSPHETLGSLVTAVLQAETPPSLATLRAAAREGLAPAKRPRRWLLTETVPRTAAGKPARGVVTEQLAGGGFAGRTLS